VWFGNYFEQFFFLIIQAATEEGVVVGGGCSLLRLSKKIDAIKESSLDNIEQKVVLYYLSLSKRVFNEIFGKLRY
jgi:hypothetical protein